MIIMLRYEQVSNTQSFVNQLKNNKFFNYGSKTLNIMAVVIRHKKGGFSKNKCLEHNHSSGGDAPEDTSQCGKDGLRNDEGCDSAVLVLAGFDFTSFDVLIDGTFANKEFPESVMEPLEGGEL